MGRVIELRKQSQGEADVFLLAEGNMAATIPVSRVAVTLPESKSSARSHMSSAREPGDLHGVRQVMVTAEHPRKGASRKPGRRAMEESDALVVPKKSTNSQVTLEELMEGRGTAKEKPAARNTRRTQRRISVPTSLQRVGTRATESKEIRFTNLFCHLRVPLLKAAFVALDKRAAPGVDGVDWHAYGSDLEQRLVDLEDRRSQRGGKTVPQWKRFEEKYDLLRPRVVHPWPEQRFAVR